MFRISLLSIFLLSFFYIFSGCGGGETGIINTPQNVPTVFPTSGPTQTPPPSALSNIEGRVYESNGFIAIENAFILYYGPGNLQDLASGDPDATAASDTEGNYAFYNVLQGECVLKFWRSENDYRISPDNPLGIKHDFVGSNTAVINLVAGFLEPTPLHPDVTPVPPGSSDYEFVAKWGIAGTGDGQFSWPVKLAFDENDNIYVVDNQNHRIQKFDKDGNFLIKWGQEGEDPGDFYYPYGIAITPLYIFISDTENNRIERFDHNGNFQLTWGAEAVQGENNDYRFSFPHGICVDPSGNVYVLDSNHHHIHKFIISGGSVVIDEIFGELGSGDGQFHVPTDIASDSSGYIYIADYNNFRVQKLDYNGNFISKWGSPGTGDGEFMSPYAITADSAGYVYVTDTVSHRVQKFTAQGDFVTEWGSSGNHDGQFFYPSGIAVNSRGYVYVADSIRNDIQVFAPK